MAEWLRVSAYKNGVLNIAKKCITRWHLSFDYVFGAYGTLNCFVKKHICYGEFLFGGAQCADFGGVA